MKRKSLKFMDLIRSSHISIVISYGICPRLAGHRLVGQSRLTFTGHKARRAEKKKKKKKKIRQRPGIAYKANEIVSRSGYLAQIMSYLLKTADAAPQGNGVWCGDFFLRPLSLITRLEPRSFRLRWNSLRARARLLARLIDGR